MRKYYCFSALFILALLARVVTVCGASEPIVLSGDAVSFSISPEDGRVLNVLDKKSGKTVIENSYDLYVRGNISRDERTDKVKTIESGKDSVKLACVNGDLGLTIEKTYTLKDNLLSKKATYRTGDSEPEKYEIYSQVEMNGELRKGGYYYRPMDDGYKVPGAVIIPAYLVTKDNRLTTSAGYLVCYLKSLNKTVGQYVYRIDGHIAYNNPALVAKATPSGWVTAVGQQFVSASRSVTFETHLALVDGDPRYFDARYFSLPEYAEFGKVEAPSWVGDTAIWGVCPELYSILAPDGFGSFQKQVELCLDFVPDGQYMLALINHYTMAGDYRSTGTMKYPPVGMKDYSGRVSAEAVKEIVAKLHAISPKIKVGFYSIGSFVSEESETFMKQHPEWLAKDEKDNLMETTDGIGKCYVLDVANPDWQDFAVGQYRDTIDNLGVDFLYMDNAPGESINWSVPRVASTADYTELFRKIHRMANAKNVALMMNHAAGVNLMCDIGILENSMGYKNLEDKDWRINAAWAFRAKMATGVRPSARIVPMWYDSAVLAQHGPGFGLITDQHAWMARSAAMVNFAKLYQKIGEELKDAWAENLDFKPSFWKLETEDLEICSLRKNSVFIFPCIWHGEDKGTEKVSIETSGMGLDPDSATFILRISPNLPEFMDIYSRPVFQKYAALVNSVAVEESGTMKTIDQKLSLMPGQQQYLIVSQVPGFIYSVGGRRSVLLMPEVSGVKMEGQLKKGTTGSYAVKVIVGSGKAEILLYVPPAWPDVSVEVDGAAAKGKTVDLRGSRFVLLPVDKGSHTLKISKLNAAAVSVSPFESIKADIWSEQFRTFSWNFYGLDYETGYQAGRCTLKLKGLNGASGGKVVFDTFPLNFGDGVRLSVLGQGGQEKVWVTLPGWQWSRMMDFKGWKDFVLTRQDFTQSSSTEWPKGRAFPEIAFSNLGGQGLTIGDFSFIKAKAGAQKETGAKEIKALRTENPPVIDGFPTDGCWEKADGQKLLYDEHGDKPFSSAEVKLAYDDQNLYILVNNPQGIIRSAPKQERDYPGIDEQNNVEILFEPQFGGGSYFRYMVDSAGNVKDSRGDSQGEETAWNSAIRTAITINYNVSWIMEAAIPFQDLGIFPKPGDKWGVNVFRSDVDANEISSWNFSAGGDKVPENAGTLVFLP
ncbi:MAG: sugar-binding protein [Candidatus Omnitrophota bacterium]